MCFTAFERSLELLVSKWRLFFDLLRNAYKVDRSMGNFMTIPTLSMRDVGDAWMGAKLQKDGRD